MSDDESKPSARKFRRVAPVEDAADLDADLDSLRQAADKATADANTLSADVQRMAERGTLGISAAVDKVEAVLADLRRQKAALHQTLTNAKKRAKDVIDELDANAKFMTAQAALQSAALPMLTPGQVLASMDPSTALAATLDVDAPPFAVPAMSLAAYLEPSILDTDLIASQVFAIATELPDAGRSSVTLISTTRMAGFKRTYAVKLLDSYGLPCKSIRKRDIHLHFFSQGEPFDPDNVLNISTETMHDDAHYRYFHVHVSVRSGVAITIQYLQDIVIDFKVMGVQLARMQFFPVIITTQAALGDSLASMGFIAPTGKDLLGAVSSGQNWIATAIRETSVVNVHSLKVNYAEPAPGMDLAAVRSVTTRLESQSDFISDAIVYMRAASHWNLFAHEHNATTAHSDCWLLCVLKTFGEYRWTVNLFNWKDRSIHHIFTFNDDYAGMFEYLIALHIDDDGMFYLFYRNADDKVQLTRVPSPEAIAEYVDVDGPLEIESRAFDVPATVHTNVTFTEHACVISNGTPGLVWILNENTLELEILELQPDGAEIQYAFATGPTIQTVTTPGTDGPEFHYFSPATHQCLFMARLATSIVSDYNVYNIIHNINGGVFFLFQEIGNNELHVVKL